MLQNNVKYILLNNWDPIGINDIEEAQDEYDIYLDAICQMLISNKSEDEIFQYLMQIEVERMGLEIDIVHTGNIAKQLVSIYQELCNDTSNNVK